VTKRCSLMYLPEAEIGDYVLVQNKIAMTLMNEEEAQECIDELNANDLLTDLPQ
ncbi:HypC/HybG/HupF family hydrogenase formation chaperone, partial [Klebsiella pneumoniae]|nr:HypC/HybG/HupF family hydrogenase formation chaperone [Klebsiella pneumoniae]